MEAKIFINGEWIQSDSPDTIEVLRASDGAVIGSIAAGNAADVDRAVKAASAAFNAWASLPGARRAAFCTAIADELASRADEIATLISDEVGTPRKLSKALQAGLPVVSFRNAAGLAAADPTDDQQGSTTVVRQPVGVVAAITPWNYPLHQIAAKVAYALAAGCTVVVKPSEIAPLNALILAEAVEKAQLPDGVFNLVTGAGPSVGEALVMHPLVNQVSFTGSTRAGRQVAAAAAGNLTRVTLELGGKSPNILLDDLDDQEFEAAVRAGIGKCFINNGQTCTALTRMLVPRRRLEAAERVIAAEVEAKWQPGPPDRDGVRVGPLASAEQVARVRDYIELGLNEGATLVTGGPDAPPGLPREHYVRSTVFSGVSNDMRIAREEIFGPVLVLIAYDDEDDAVRLANDSPYGLSAGVIGADAQQAERVARRLRTGQVDVNNGRFDPTAPFGGFKHSGYGRELGRPGFEEFLATTTLFH